MALWLNRRPVWMAPAILLGVVLLSYGLWIPWWGLFGNDLPYLWYFHLLGPMGPGEFAAMDRPVSALFYAVVSLAFGEHVWLYHGLLLVLRWLSAVLLWWVLKIVWPGRTQEAALAALLFAVYPGFRQNPVALEFILHFAVLDLFLVSLGATLLAARCPHRYIPLAAGAALGAAGLFSLEYFVGLEILRPVFLWIILRQQGLTGRRRWGRLFKAWLPALVVVSLFLFWRVVIFSFPTYKPVLLDEVRADPLLALGALSGRIFQDLSTALGGAWRQVFSAPAGRRQILVFAALVAAGAAATVFAMRFSQQGTANRGEGAVAAVMRPEQARLWGETVVGIGLLAMLAGGSVFWVTGIPVSLAFPWDRSTLSFMLGASLVVTGLFEMLVVPRYRPALAAVLVGLAIGLHFQNALEYRAEWQKLQKFYWQLAWRAPGLEPGTLILFDVIPLNRYSDSDLTALLNWTYAPDLTSRQLPYKFFDLTIRLDSEHAGISRLEKDIPVEHNHRGTFFKTSTSSTLALVFDPPACLRILRPEDALLPGLPERLARALPITRLEQIWVDAGGVRPPAQLGQEPPHDWCYFFERADLARQQEDWAGVVALGQEAFAAGFRWENPVELLPFIEGYARAGMWEKTTDLAREAGQHPGLRASLCALWDRVEIGLGGDGKAGTELNSLRSETNCQP